LTGRVSACPLQEQQKRKPLCRQGNHPSLNSGVLV
jgi:hypothetical protein